MPIPLKQASVTLATSLNKAVGNQVYICGKYQRSNHQNNRLSNIMTVKRRPESRYRMYRKSVPLSIVNLGVILPPSPILPQKVAFCCRKQDSLHDFTSNNRFARERYWNVYRFAFISIRTMRAWPTTSTLKNIKTDPSNKRNRDKTTHTNFI